MEAQQKVRKVVKKVRKVVKKVRKVVKKVRKVVKNDGQSDERPEEGNVLIIRALAYAANDIEHNRFQNLKDELHENQIDNLRKQFYKTANSLSKKNKTCFKDSPKRSIFEISLQ